MIREKHLMIIWAWMNIKVIDICLVIYAFGQNL